MTRKCFLQLAYEHAECAAPCGKYSISPLQSIRVQVPCQECSAKLTEQVHKIAAIKQQIDSVKKKLKIDVDGRGKLDADFGKSENETLSPVPLVRSEKLAAETT
ncbi:hypothetical protein SLS53_003123 [Cytospora paraplurivora]|uniref:Uncharacterized protein n=1 Tax=Cytospora paraplurivora TaxID=2898453 RepID=A0AAN9YJP4_9PEZI